MAAACSLLVVTVGYGDAIAPSSRPSPDATPTAQRPGIQASGGDEDFAEDWEGFKGGEQPCGTNGWEEWAGSEDVCATISEIFSNSGINSLEIVGNVGGKTGLGDDIVQRFAIDSGRWTMRAMTYMPSRNVEGIAWIIMLNQYSPDPNNWSVQAKFDSNFGNNGVVSADDGTGGGNHGEIPMFYDSWVEFRVEIDLAADTVDFFYDDALFADDVSWREGLSGGGLSQIRALDLYGDEPDRDGVTGFYIDDVQLTAVRGACCTKDGVCADGVLVDDCAEIGGRFAFDTLCENLDPPCVEQTGACCIAGPCREPAWICDGDTDGDGQVNPVDSGLVQSAFGSADDQDLCNYDIDCDGQINPVDSGIVQSLFGTCDAPRDECGGGGGGECQVLTPSVCLERRGDFQRFGLSCDPDPCAGESPCLWNNGIVPDGLNARAMSPPAFPNIRVVDDLEVFGNGCILDNLHINVNEDAAWRDGDDLITVTVYARTDNGPGEIVESVRSQYTRISTGDTYFDRSNYRYRIEGLGIELEAGNYWVGVRNDGGTGSGTNFWLTSDGGEDGFTSRTGMVSFNGGNTWREEGAAWHHAFEINP